MAIIEEIPDALPAGLKGPNLEAMVEAASAAHFGTGDGTPGAALPDAIASVKNSAADEFIRQLNKMPLFMAELDETGEDDSSPNVALDAIRALQEEGEPHEIARNFKASGNERFKWKNYADAREFYTKALGAKCDDDEINIACLNNRAQCNLEMGNYRKCITDCREALKINPKADKPWFRSAKALLAVDRTEEAEACVKNAVMLNPTHTQIQQLAEKIAERKEHLARQEVVRLERERKRKWEENAIKVALQARNIPTRSTSSPPEMPDGIAIAFSEPGKLESHLNFPVLLIYHLHLQTDVIAGMPEVATIGDQLVEVLAEPQAWDEKREYTTKTVECYMETKTGGLIKVGKKVSLLEVLSGGKVVVVDGLVRILLVPKARTAEFVEGWKKTMRTAQ